MMIFTMPEGKVIAIDEDYITSVQPGSCSEPGSWTMIELNSDTVCRVWVRGAFYDVVHKIAARKDQLVQDGTES